MNLETKTQTNKKQNRHYEAGFSLLEILVALTLLGGIVAFVGGRVLDSLHEGNVKAAKIQMGNLATQLKEFKRKCNFYPTQDQGLEALISKPSGKECKKYPPNGFLDGELGVPLDPWDNDYVYESDGRRFNIKSLGPDNEEGGEGQDADILLYESNK
ncbi:MAG: type II secretion system major pseudopilin GspG [Bacteriovoracaceae bacterium]